jgi:glycosyltransferase involved in cell wall biosynthesis
VKILCSISTKNRYDTFLPLAIQSVINQTRLPDKLVIFDDNDPAKDIRDDPKYLYLLRVLERKNLPWEVIFAAKKGQHHNHQMANTMGYDWVWRIDDDNTPEQNVLEHLCSYVDHGVGAIGGSVLTPQWGIDAVAATGKIENIDSEPNIQWGHINQVHEVDHLHCSFLYRAGIADYNLGLSKVAHREETLFTYQLKQKGYKNLVVPNTVTWHAKSEDGGIRSHTDQEWYYHDEQIFRNIVGLKDQTIVILDCGMGDHVVFKRVLRDIKNPIVFSCYPEIVPGRSIAEAIRLYGSIESYNVYHKMNQWNWTGSLEDAFRKLYGAGV